LILRRDTTADSLYAWANTVVTAVTSAAALLIIKIMRKITNWQTG